MNTNETPLERIEKLCTAYMNLSETISDPQDNLDAACPRV